MENKGTARDRIALCVIVGNEPKRLDRCLSLFAPAVSELVVVHAHGGTPASLEVAQVCEKHGAKYDVYTNAPEHAEWPHVDNFAAARQKSFDLASKEWALWADSDDVPGENFAPALWELVENYGEKFDGFVLYHDVAGRGIKHNLRERLVKREKGRWQNAVHENFVIPGGELAKCEAPVVVHLPDDEPKQGTDRNIRILESIPPDERGASVLYHLSGELQGLGRKSEAIKYATEAARHPQCGINERYELFMNLADMARPETIDTSKPEYWQMVTMLHSAYRTMPNRREALALLGAMHLDIGDMVNSEAYLRAMMALPEPVDKPWTHRHALYGWGGEQLWTQFLRMSGQTEKADAIERARLKAQKAPTISVVHPTRGNPQKAALVRKKFLDNAKHPERIEYIFGIEADSPDAGIIGRFRHALAPAGMLGQTNCVAATNAATRASCGDIIIYAQDDLDGPPLHWDERIIEALGGDTKRPAAVKIGDGLRADDLLCTPCLTRSAVEALGYAGGLYFDGYRSMFADTELTWRLTKLRAIVPSDIVIRHLHDPNGNETTARSNSLENYKQGWALFKQRNPNHEQACPDYWREMEKQFAALEK